MFLNGEGGGAPIGIRDSVYSIKPQMNFNFLLTMLHVVNRDRDRANELQGLKRREKQDSLREYNH